MSRVQPDLLAALRAGEPWAVDALYRDHAAAVLAWCLRLGGPQIDAEDTAHEVFIVALRRLAGLRGEATLSTWLYAITRRVVANARRRAAFRRFLGLEQAPEPRSGAPLADEEIERHRQRRQVQHALERLSAPLREVIVLAELEERAAPEVAHMLDIPVGTVYSRLHAARRAFAAALQTEGLDPEIAPDARLIPLRRA